MTDWKKDFPEWEPTAEFCGPNRYIAGDQGDDFDAWNSVQVYYNMPSGLYYLDQPFATNNPFELSLQLHSLLSRLDEKLLKGEVQ